MTEVVAAAVDALRASLEAEGIEPHHIAVLVDLENTGAVVSWPEDHGGCIGAMMAEVGTEFLKEAADAGRLPEGAEVVDIGQVLRDAMGRHGGGPTMN